MRFIAYTLAVLTVLAPAPARVRVDGTAFVRADGGRFQWRGITAFRLAEMIAHGREKEAAAYLEWASSQRLTVVRVFTMAHHLFKLAPSEGVAALPRLLDMAAARGLYVEIVALSDTTEIEVDIAAHVDAIGRIAGRYSNAVVEIANEPVHPTQRRDIHDADVLRKAASAIPPGVPVSLGSVERGDGFAGGTYVTWHVPRHTDPDGWGHVIAVSDGARLVQKWKKPVVSDEPIGASSNFIAGRRDNDPARFRAAALVTRLAGVNATFHYEGGLQARIPRGRELECFNAWNDAWGLLPVDVEQVGKFAPGGEQRGVVRSYDKSAAAGVYERASATHAWIVGVAVRGEPRVQLATGWNIVRRQRFPGVLLITARRSAA